MAGVEVSGLTKNFGAVTAVREMSFTAPPGKVTGFLGPNGSGKTTTLRMVLGLVRPDAGSALIGGVPYGRLTPPRRTVGGAAGGQRVPPGAAGQGPPARPRRRRGHPRHLVLAGYAVVFAAAAMVTTLRRDVT